MCFIQYNVVELLLNHLHQIGYRILYRPQTIQIDIVFHLLVSHASYVCSKRLVFLLGFQCQSVGEHQHSLAILVSIRVERLKYKGALTTAARRIYKVDTRWPLPIIRDFKILLYNFLRIIPPFSSIHYIKTLRHIPPSSQSETFLNICLFWRYYTSKTSHSQGLLKNILRSYV